MQKRFAKGVVTLLSVVTLAACAKGATEDTKLVTMKGDTITVADFYSEVKNTSASQQAMLTLVLSRVFEAQYGDKVTDEQVAEAYNKTAEQYGDNFANALAQVGLTTETYKQELRKNLLLDHAVEEAAKAELTDEAYAKAFETYTPEVTAQVILLASEEEAKAVLEQVRAEGADFGAIAKEKTKAPEVDYKFDSAENNLPAEVRAAAAGLDINAVSEIVTVTNQQTFTIGYYIIKTTAKAEKAADWKTYKDRLETMILAEKKADSNFQRQVVASALEKANVKIKDEAFANILAVYATTDEAASTASEASSESSSSSTEKSE